MKDTTIALIFGMFVLIGIAGGVAINRMNAQEQTPAPSASEPAQTPEQIAQGDGGVAKETPGETDEKSTSEDPKDAPSVYKSNKPDDDTIYFFDRLAHCTVDGYGATFMVHGSLPVQRLSRITPEQLAALKKLYVEDLQPVYQKGLDSWAGRNLAADVKEQFYNPEHSNMQMALGIPLANGLGDFMLGMMDVVGFDIAGKLRIYADALELSDAPVPQCPASVPENAPDPFADADGLAAGQLPHIFKGTGKLGAEDTNIFLYDRFSHCTADKHLLNYAIEGTIPVDDLAVIDKAQLESLSTIYGGTLRPGIRDSMNAWAKATKAAQVGDLLPYLQDHKKVDDSDDALLGRINDAMELMSPHLQPALQSSLEQIFDLLGANMTGNFKIVYVDGHVSSDPAPECGG